ncbi:MAG: hypothetical protein JNK46_09455 [Methylobacteriaceae bacterium]|nr:hypothetical protein [Methylobacteriaceae bacterium]
MAAQPNSSKVMAKRSKAPDPETSERAEMLLAHVESLGREQAVMVLAATAESLTSCIRALSRLPADPAARDARRLAAKLFAR